MGQNSNLNRRNVLKLTGGTVTAAGLTGFAAGSDRVEVNVGFSNGAGRQAAEQAASSVKREFNFNAMTAEMPAVAAEKLQNNPNIRYVEENGTYQALGQVTPYGIEKVEADTAINDGYTGDGANIAIVDSGIDAQHETLAGNLGEGWAADDAECDADCGGGGPFGGGNDIEECLEVWDDDNDHGSHCAGTAAAEDNGLGVLGVAPEATLQAVKVLDCDGSGSWDGVAAGIEWAADQNQVDVLSMSLGGDSDSDVVRDAVEYAHAQGKIQVAAAGNSGPCNDCVGYPAAYDEVIAVSATDENDDLASFSSTGPEVELAAPGVDTLSTIPRDDYAEFSGTSMSCPHVSGAVATLVAAGVAPGEVRQQLKEAADDIGLDDNEQGAGRLNVAAALDVDGGGDDGEENTAPSCSITNPNDGDTVSDTVTVQVDASDEEDDDTTLDVEVSIDGGTYQAASYNSNSGYYEYDWDTTAEDGGDHTIDARATDSDGATTDATQITVTVDNGDDGGEENTAPVIDSWSVSTRSTGPWSRAETSWSVSDDNGNLDTVTTDLLDGGSVVDSETSSVSGSSASGEHEVRTRDNPDEVRLTVTDEEGESTSETQSI